MLLALAAAGLVTGSPAARMPHVFAHRFGFSSHDAAHGDWLRMATSVFLTSGPLAFWSALFMTGLGVGLLERRRGTRTAALTFGGIHVLSLFVMSLVILAPIPHSDVWPRSLLVRARDVGPSAGYFGCLGAYLGGRRGRWTVLSAGLFLWLVAFLTWRLAAAAHVSPASLTGDLAHVIAFPAGWAAGRWMMGRAS